MIKKKILIGSIFAALLMVSIPLVTSLQVQPVIIKEDTSVISQSPPEFYNTMSLEELIVGLQYVIDNLLDGYDEGFILEFQHYVDILSQGPTSKNFCLALLAITGILYILTRGPKLIKFRNIILIPLTIAAAAIAVVTCVLSVGDNETSYPDLTELASTIGITEEDLIIARSSGCGCME